MRATPLGQQAIALGTKAGALATSVVGKAAALGGKVLPTVGKASSAMKSTLGFSGSAAAVAGKTGALSATATIRRIHGNLEKEEDQTLVEKAVTFVNNTKEAVQGAIEGAKETFKLKFNNTKEAVKTVVDEAKDTIISAKNILGTIPEESLNAEESTPNMDTEETQLKKTLATSARAEVTNYLEPKDRSVHGDQSEIQIQPKEENEPKVEVSTKEETQDEHVEETLDKPKEETPEEPNDDESKEASNEEEEAEEQTAEQEETYE